MKKNNKNCQNQNSSKIEIEDPVLDYVNDVLSEKIIAGRWVRLACERHLRDLDRKDLFWDLAAAKRIFRFFSTVLRLNGGQFEGQPFDLLPFECFIVGSIFGWKMPDGTRRYQMAYIEEGKGNGKSPLAAGIGMVGLIADAEPRAEIYAAATKKDQAMILFRDAVAMRDQSPELKKRLVKSGVGEKCWNLAYHKFGSWFRPISSDEDSQSGPRPHMALVDEVHEHKTPIVISMLEEGFKFRRNPLLFMITNSGFDQETVCYYYHDYVTRILKQIAHNDRLFGFIAALDPCEEHWNEGLQQPKDDCQKCDQWAIEGDHWYKANPALDKIITRQRLRDNVRKGLDVPSEQNTVRRLNFCYWTNQATRWLSMDSWDACGLPIDFERLRGRSCIIGLDLANKIDIAALVQIFPPERFVLTEKPAEKEKNSEEETQINYSTIDIQALAEEFIIVPHFFIPKETIREAMNRDQVPYDVWIRDGLIYATEGNVIDYQAIRQKLVALNDISPIRTKLEAGGRFHLAGFDPWNATEFANVMKQSYSINMIEVRQGYQSMSEPTKEMARLIKAKKIHHGGNPVLRWMADNMIVRTDPAGNVKPDKDKSKKKIDGIVALIIAFSLAIRYGTAKRKSIYEERGLITIDA